MRRWPGTRRCTRRRSRSRSTTSAMTRHRRRTAAPAMRTASRSGSGGAPTTRRCSPPPRRTRSGWRARPSISASPNARRRIAEELPDAKLVVVVRDPIDRAYSNWMHLWVDGLEPMADFVAAWHAEDERIADGWAPFWHYRRMGRYGEQLADLLRRVDRDRVLVLRYWQLVSPAGRDPGPGGALPRRRRGPARTRAARTTPARSSTRAGARRCSARHPRRRGRRAAAPPEVWRRASRPLLSVLQQGGAAQRPRLSVEQRTALLETAPPTSPSWRRCSASPSRTGRPPPAAARSPSESEDS